MTDIQSLRENFWELPLEQLNEVEWEMLCDGCGRCCLKKIEDEDSGKIHWTRIVCQYLDTAACRCSSYSQRTTLVPSCLNVRDMYRKNVTWMPDTCAYRLRAESKPLFAWHPLLTGSSEAMINADISVQGRTLSEEFVHPDGYDEHIIRWVES